MNRPLPLLLALAPLLGALAGCDTVEVLCDAADASADCLPPEVAVYVGNQGNFTDETGSVTVFDPSTGQATQNAFGFEDALVQGIVVDPETDARGYVLLNFNDSFSTGDGLLAVVDLEEGRRIADVPVGTPRSAVRVGTTLWVTNLYGNAVTPVDLATFTAGDSLAVGQNPEGIVAAGGRLYVANFGFGFSTTVSVIDPSARAVEETLDVGCDGPRALGVDGEGEVWVFCTGQTDFATGETTDGAVVVLDGATGDEVARMPLDAQIRTESLGQDAFVNAARAEAWAVRADGALLHFDTAANALVGTVTPEIPEGYLLGAVAADDAGRLYVGAFPPDFVSAGQIVVLDGEGQQVMSAPAGVIPAAIALR